MKRKCFISCKTEDFDYKRYIQEQLEIDFIDKSLNEAINSIDEEYIMRKIREDYLSDSTVTIHLIGSNSNENLGWDEQKYIKRELQASLFHSVNNTRNGVLGIVLPSMYTSIYQGLNTCSTCQREHSTLHLNNNTTIREFSYNYFIPNGKCSHTEDERYCVLTKWENFIQLPENYIELAYNKRFHNISNRIIVRPI